MDVIAELNKANRKFQLVYWLVAIAAILLVGLLSGRSFGWVIGIAAGVLSSPIGKAAQKKQYEAIIRKRRIQADQRS